MVITQLLRPEELVRLDDRHLDILEDHIERELITNDQIKEILRKRVTQDAKTLLAAKTTKK